MTKIIGSKLPNMPWQDAIGDMPVWRYSGNPVIKRNPIPNVSRVFNSAVVPFNGKFVGIFRGDTVTGVPYLYYGESQNGIDFTFDNKPLQFHLSDGSLYKFEYAYDPRLVEIDGVYYIIWCDGYRGGPTLGIGKTTDFVHYEMLERPLLPYNRNGVLFPRKINGEYVLLSRPSDNGHTPFGDIYLSKSKDMEYWGKHRMVMQHGYEWWQALKIGAGCVPIETDEGWLLIYHGANKTCSGYIYCMGAALLDENLEVTARCTNIVLEPQEIYETVGYVPNVIFPVSALCDAETGRIAIYYGSADTVVSLAFTEVNRLVDYIKRNGRK